VFIYDIVPLIDRIHVTIVYQVEKRS